MIRGLASGVARCLLELAVVALVFAVALGFAAGYVASLPYRRLRGPSVARRRFEAGQQLLVALAAFVAALRAPADPT